jgi:hypothetical protein
LFSSERNKILLLKSKSFIYRVFSTSIFLTDQNFSVAIQRPIMELRYRGQSYQVKEAQIETIPSDIIALFLGKPYFVRRPLNLSSSQLGLKKYRGIAYGN